MNSNTFKLGISCFLMSDSQWLTVCHDRKEQ